MTRTVLLVLLFTSLISGVALAQDASPSAQEILDRVNETWQGDSFHGIIGLDIILGGQTKSHKLEVWTLGEELALIRILEPEIDLNSGYLQLGDELWFYSPGVGSIKLPSIALGDAVFGAGPSLEDLSHGTLSDDYDVTAEETETGFFLTLIPHPDAPVVYGKLETWVTYDYVMERLQYFDQRGEKLQTAVFSDVMVVGDRKFATTIVIEDAFGDRTIQRIEAPQFDLVLDAMFFRLETFEAWGEGS